MAVLLTAKDVSVEYPAKKVLQKITLGVNEGDRIGIVGKNGDGKSTLMSVLSSSYPPDSGEVTYRGTPTIGVLTQQDTLDDEVSVKYAIVGDAPQYTWASDRRIREIIDALISDIDWDSRIAVLSGGQRRRVDLARLLIKDWDILMLDEPTNHLDMNAITWLANHLKNRWTKDSGALLVITHDRWFLDEVALNMWEVHDGHVDSFEGGFSAYIQQRVERERQAQLAETKRQNMLRKELAWLSRGARARSSKPKFHLKAALELIADDPPLRNSLELKRAAITRLGKQVLDLEKVSKSYDDQVVLDEIDWLIGPGDRFGILGENGAGKTSLLNILLGSIQPSSGRIKVGKTVKMALLSQRLEELEASSGDRVREVLGQHKTRITIDGKSITSADLLERLGFERGHLNSFVRDLSGGQKRRLQLLLTLIDEPNVLILDEPGNDMDTDMLAVMEDLLDSWPGTLILVSHDRYLMERVTDDQFALIDGKIRHMPGGVDEYLKMLDEKPPSSKDDKGKAQVKEGRTKELESNETSVITSKPLSGGETYRMQKQLASTERKLASLEEQLKKVTEQMHDCSPSDYLALGEFEAKLQEINAQINELEEEWLHLSDALGK